MSAPVVSEPALREHLMSWLSGSHSTAKTILLRGQPLWSGPAVLTIGDTPVRVVEGISALAVLDAERAAAASERLAVLTTLTAAELGSAVVLQAHRQRVEDLDEWNLVPGLFGARENVSRSVRDLGPWLPKLLLSTSMPQRFIPAPAGVLSAEHVIKSVLAAFLELDRLDVLDSSEALAAIDNAAVRARFRDLDEASREGLLASVAQHVDPYLTLALRSVTTTGQLSPVAVGLVVGELWAAAPLDASGAAARVRIEQFIGVDPSEAAARNFGAAARLIAQRWLAFDSDHGRWVLEQADALCEDIAWQDGAADSEVLLAGLSSRKLRFAAAVQAAAKQPSVDTAAAVDAAFESLKQHRAQALLGASLETAEMATRLVRWLCVAPELDNTLNGRVLDYLADGAWADRALADIWHGETQRQLAESYQALALAVQQRRREQDSAAAQQLTGAHLLDDQVIPIEQLLSRVVVPLSAQQHVLLIVLDGMSAPTAVELAEELPTTDWVEIVPEDTLRRGAALAVLPTVTTYSRTSLLAGELLAGNQQTEKSKFAAAVKGVLFHKDELRSEAGHALPPTVTAAIADPGNRIVGVVLNTIDDALASADVDSLRWHLDSVSNLRPLLQAAREAGRVVVFTSDHGHVVERGSELRNVAEASSRWREPSSGPLQADEVLVSGPRVLAPGGEAVLAVSDAFRYASKKAGYHGGASLAELVIPINVFTPRGTANLAGWRDAPPQKPEWWHEPARGVTHESAVPAQQTAPKKSKSVKAPAPKSADAAELFELAPEPSIQEEVAEPGGSGDVVSELLASSTYQSRRKTVGRHPIEDAQASAILSALLSGNGRAHRDTLAVRAGVPGEALAGVLSALRRVLNIDGYAVVDIDADGVTVMLNIALLREQFELGVA